MLFDTPETDLYPKVGQTLMSVSPKKQTLLPVFY